MGELDLSKFNDFFGLFAALNLAYAGSERFRDIVDTDILKLGKVEKKKSQTVQILLDKVKMLDDRCQAVFSPRVADFKDKHKKDFRLLNHKRIVLGSYPEGCKSMFLITTLYCMSMLLISGYQDVAEQEVFLNIFFYLNLVTVFNIFIFIRSFTSKVSKRVRPTYTLLIFLALIVFSLVCNRYCILIDHTSTAFSLNANSAISIIIAVSPYAIHSMRALCHKMIFRYQYGRKLKKMELEAKDVLNYMDNAARDFALLAIHSDQNSANQNLQ